MLGHEKKNVLTEGLSRHLRTVPSLHGKPGADTVRSPDYTTRQTAAWRESWLRLPDDADARLRFLERVGRYLGESRSDAAIQRARGVLGIQG